MCKECIGHKEYKSFDELPQELKELYKGKETKKGKDAYVGFINKLNKNDDELVSDYVNAKTKVRIHYGKCGHIHPKEEGVTPDNYKRGNGCGICNGKIVIEGDNDLATKRPELAKEWHPTKNGDLKPTQITYKSNKKVWWLCKCGYEWEVGVNSRTSNNSSCPNCGDGTSYAEKLVALVLKKLGVEFTRQLRYKNGKHKYDFYIALWKVILETHGEQHYRGWSGDRNDLLWQEANDENKRYDAIHFLGLGIRNEDYHEINCKYSTLEWCRPNIEEVLSKYIDTSILTDEDWEEFDKEAQKSNKIEACLYWKEQKEINKDLTTAIMADMFKVDKNTIRTWLIWGNENGLCTYSGEEERKAKTKRLSKFVYLIKPDGTKWYNEAMSQRELSRLTRINDGTIGLHRKDGKPLSSSKRANNIKHDSKYIGSYIVEEDELEEFLLNLKGGDIIE